VVQVGNGCGLEKKVAQHGVDRWGSGSAAEEKPEKEISKTQNPDK